MSPLVCNGCEVELEEDDLVLMRDEGGDFMNACPHCLTDDFLMQEAG